jgi:hypothetical protein
LARSQFVGIDAVLAQNTRAENLSHAVPGIMREGLAVGDDGVFAAADGIAEFNGGWEAEVRRVIVRGDPVEEMLKGRETWERGEVLLRLAWERPG